VASKEVKNFILKLMHERATRYRWSFIWAVGASLNLIVNYNPGEDVENKFPQWTGFYVKDR
jgi:hypothetical protein